MPRIYQPGQRIDHYEIIHLLARGAASHVFLAQDLRRVKFGIWYSLCQMGVSIIAVVIAVWMIDLYRHYGVWAMGRKKKTSLE